MIVGSGAGGGVIAGELAQAGLKVVVLEAGGYFDESDFNQLELWAYQNLYWRGGPHADRRQNITLLAGATLGGGHGRQLDQLPAHPAVGARAVGARVRARGRRAAPDFDRHLDAVLERIGVNDACSDLNGPQRTC